jgi:23S rRNA pseudouridine1911/1915/1917 synthase
MKYIVPQDLTLLEALTALSPQSSKTTLRSWLKEGRITVDGQVMKLGHLPVLQGQTIRIGPRRKMIEGGVEILYEDTDLVVIDKPSGLLSVATFFEKGETAHAILKNYFRPRKIFVVHRIDQDTSGVMLFALNEKSYENLKKTFEAHDIERSYTAIVEGRMEAAKGTWQSLLYEDDNYVVKKTEDADRGQEAITHYRTELATKAYSWLTLTLETGRKNQIRVHCQEAGHSIVGDKKYGAKSNPLKRLALHAHLLAFKHPVTGQPLRFESPPPREFLRLVGR